MVRRGGALVCVVKMVLVKIVVVVVVKGKWLVSVGSRVVRWLLSLVGVLVSVSECYLLLVLPAR